MTSVTDTNRQLVRLHFIEKAKLFKVFHNPLASLVPVKPLVGQKSFIFFLSKFSEESAGVDRGVFGDNHRHLEIMAFTYFEIVRIVRRSNFDCPASKFGIRIRIGYQRDAAIDQRQSKGLANKMLVAGVLRVDCNRYVAKHSFGASSRHCYITGSVFEWITDMP